MKLDIKKIKSIRKEKGLTQKDLANVSGISQGELSKIESGSSNVTLYTINELANSLQICPLKLITRKCKNCKCE